MRVVNTCPFDENAHLIRGTQMKQRMLDGGFAQVSTKYRVFFPHGLRGLRALEGALAWLPLGGQYFARAVK